MTKPSSLLASFAQQFLVSEKLISGESPSMSPDCKGAAWRDNRFGEASPPLRVRRLPGKEDELSCIAPLDPALQDGRSALRQHFVRREQAGHLCY